MAREKEEHEEGIIKCIKKENLFTIEMIFTYYNGLAKTQFYNLKLNESNRVLKALQDNKVKVKSSLYKKWEKSDNATLQIALYKAICEQEERVNLSQSNVDHTTKGDKIGTPDLSHLSTEDIEKLLKKGE